MSASTTGAATDVPLVAHVIFRLDIGGLENGLVNLINQMSPARYRHAIICIDDYSDFSRRLRRDDVQLYALHKRPGADLSVHLKMWRLLRRLRPAIVHTRNLGSLEYQAAAFAAGVRHRVHGLHGWDMMDLHGTSAKYNALNRLMKPLISRYVVLSRELGGWLQRTIGVQPSRMVRICNGVDTGRFVPRQGDVAVMPDDAFGGRAAGGGTLVVGWVGRMQAVKDPVNLARAFADAANRPELADVDLRLTMIGDGALREEVVRVLKEAGVAERCWLPGARDDVAGLMQAMDLFVLPSLNEGISNTILEAMACGLPVVATEVGGNPELVAQNETGELVPVSDSRALADAIVAYACDLPRLRRHAKAARRRAESRYSLSGMVDRYAQLYDALCSGRTADAVEEV